MERRKKEKKKKKTKKRKMKGEEEDTGRPNLRLKIPPPKARRRLNFDSEISEWELEIEKNLWAVYAKVVDRQLGSIVEAECYGCQHDQPSQSDHGICIGTTYTEQQDQFLDNAVAGVDMDVVTELWSNKISEQEPPLSARELLKYNNSEWVCSRLESEPAGNLRLKNNLDLYID